MLHSAPNHQKLSEKIFNRLNTHWGFVLGGRGKGEEGNRHGKMAPKLKRGKKVMS
jgi:hypothetical protein